MEYASEQSMGLILYSAPLSHVECAIQQSDPAVRVFLTYHRVGKNSFNRILTLVIVPSRPRLHAMRKIRAPMELMST